MRTLVYSAATSRDGTSRENAVVCELSESVQPRNVDSVRVGDGYACASITIYNTQGVVIRSLQFGHQSAGYYTGRDRAAYWDGRNALGEQVASGLYFYQLETDEMSLTAENGYFEVAVSFQWDRAYSSPPTGFSLKQAKAWGIGLTMNCPPTNSVETSKGAV